jgi:hypothetical protein
MSDKRALLFTHFIASILPLTLLLRLHCHHQGEAKNNPSIDGNHGNQSFKNDLQELVIYAGKEGNLLNICPLRAVPSENYLPT